MKSDYIQPTTNEALHTISAIRSMGRDAHIFVANSSRPCRRDRHRRTRGRPIECVGGEVVTPRGEVVCEPVGSRYDGENSVCQSGGRCSGVHSVIFTDNLWECAITIPARLAGGGIEEKIVEL